MFFVLKLVEKGKTTSTTFTCSTQRQKRHNDVWCRFWRTVQRQSWKLFQEIVKNAYAKKDILKSHLKHFLPFCLVSPCCLATSVTRLGDFRKFLGDTFCSKSNPNVYWLLRLFWKIWLFVKTAEGIVWATFGKFGILFISPSGHTVIAMYLKVKCRG